MVMTYFGKCKFNVFLVCFGVFFVCFVRWSQCLILYKVKESGGCHPLRH